DNSGPYPLGSFGTCPHSQLCGVSGQCPTPERAKRPAFNNAVIIGTGVAFHWPDNMGNYTLPTIVTECGKIKKHPSGASASLDCPGFFVLGNLGTPMRAELWGVSGCSPHTNRRNAIHSTPSLRRGNYTSSLWANDEVGSRCTEGGRSCPSLSLSLH